MISHKQIFIIFFALTTLLTSCISTPPVLEEDVRLFPPESKAVWNNSEISGMKILAGMDEKKFVGGAALALEIRQLQFVVDSPDLSNKAETRSARTSEFAEDSDVMVAINASPFSPVDIFNRSNRPMDIVGLHISDGILVSDSEPSYDALYILPGGRISLGSQSTVPEGTRIALGGFHMLLEDGINLGRNDMRHPRTALGLSEDRNTLFIAVFDGRQPGRAGLTTEECASWMSWLGCHSALNMDGGGSSALVLRLNGTVRILNSPIHRGKPGLERAVANHLGIIIK